MFINGRMCRVLSSMVRFRKMSGSPFGNSQLDAAHYFAFKTGLTDVEQQRILKILNSDDGKELTKYNVSSQRVKSIESWKNKNGQFKTLNDVLEVNGMGEMTLERICKRIIKYANADPEMPMLHVTDRKIKQNLYPTMTDSLTKRVKVVTGIHLSPTGISWAQMSHKGNELTDWGYEVFTTLPKKTTTVELYELVYCLLQKIPVGNVYLFENQQAASMGQQNQSVASSYHQQLELSSMLLALINTSQTHNKNVPDNCVFNLKNRLPARLFQLIIGSERISAVQTVEELLGRSEDFNLPCTPLNFNPKFKEIFNSQQPMNKELLGRALILVICFMDVFVNKNSTSLYMLFSNKSSRR